MAAITNVLAGRVAEIGAEEQNGRVAQNLLLFMATPWIGLAYIVIFPFVGFGALLGALVLRRRS